MRIGPRVRFINHFRKCCIIMFAIFIIVGFFQNSLVESVVAYVGFLLALLFLVHINYYQSIEIKNDMLVFRMGLMKKKRKISSLSAIMEMEYLTSKYAYEGKVIGFSFNDNSKRIEIRYHWIETSNIESFINNLLLQNKDIAVCFNVEKMSKYMLS